jgi:hypothetical protein
VLFHFLKFEVEAWLRERVMEVEPVYVAGYFGWKSDGGEIVRIDEAAAEITELDFHITTPSTNG